MSDLRKAAEIALDALEEINKLSIGKNAISLPASIDTAMDALRAALAIVPSDYPYSHQPLPQRQPLTDAEITCILDCGDVAERNGMGGWHVLPYALARAVERAHGIGSKDEQ